MHYLIATVGSDGDVLPLVTLGGCLRRRGHLVTLIAAFPYKHIAALNGLNFVPLSSNLEYDRSVQDKLVLNGRYSALFFRRHSVAWNVVVFVEASRVVGCIADCRTCGYLLSLPNKCELLPY